MACMYSTFSNAAPCQAGSPQVSRCLWRQPDSGRALLDHAPRPKRMPKMNEVKLIACHECDLLQWETPLPQGGTARCRRCGAALYRSVPARFDRALAFTSAAAILFVLANC